MTGYEREIHGAIMRALAPKGVVERIATALERLAAPAPEPRDMANYVHLQDMGEFLGVEVPPGEDIRLYLRSLTMFDTATPAPQNAVVKGEGFGCAGGGFAKVFVDGREFTPEQVAWAVTAMFGKGERG